MDATHYDKIADKLIQFHSKLPEDIDLTTYMAKMKVHFMKRRIEQLLKNIDEMATMDERGWIR